jgi:acyl dehydratase
MNNPISGLRTFHYHEIVMGMTAAHDYVIAPEIYEQFLAAFKDYSPLHVDEDFAKARGFPGKVMHGSLLNGFISHFVGMHFPGRFSLLLSVDLRFANPSYLGDAIRLASVVSQKMDARRIVVLDATLSNTTRDYLAARARIQVMIQEEA